MVDKNNECQWKGDLYDRTIVCTYYSVALNMCCPSPEWILISAT